MKVTVRNNDVMQAYRILKKKLQREGIIGEMRRKERYEKPSEKRKREDAEGRARMRKAEQKRNADL